MTLADVINQRKNAGISIVIEHYNKRLPVIQQQRNLFGKLKERVVDYRYWNWYSVIENGIEWIKVGAAFSGGEPLANEWFEYGKRKPQDARCDELVQSIYDDVGNLYQEQESEKLKLRKAERQERAAQIEAQKNKLYTQMFSGIQKNR